MLETTFPCFERICHTEDNEEYQAKSCGNNSDKCSHWNWIKNLKKEIDDLFSFHWLFVLLYTCTYVVASQWFILDPKGC